MEPDRDPDHARNPVRRLGAPDQMHPGFFGSSPSLPVVAFEATGHNIVPGFAPFLDDRDDMIKGQIFSGAFGAAVLTCVPVPGIDVGTAELYVLESFAHADIAQEPEHAGHPNCETDAADFLIVFGQDLDFPLKKQRNCAFPRNNIDRFIAGIEYECLFHESFPTINH